MLKETVASQVTMDINPEDLQIFNRVRIKDSTTFEIHDSLASIFDGFGKGGGPNSKAGVTIPFEFDIKDNKIIDIDIKSATQSDSKDAFAKKEDIKKGDLIIRDLGYYSDDLIAHYIKSEAFFISKLYHNVSVRLDPNKDEKLDFQKLYEQMVSLHQTHRDINIYIGKKKRPVRLIITLMPDEVYKKRVTKVNKKNQSSGYTTTKEFKNRAYFNLFICNIPSEQCSYKTICNLYKIRWQIELVFKVWKSVLNIHKLPKMSSARMLTTLYAKLLWIFINWQIVSDCRNYFYKTEIRVLSIIKCFKTLEEKSIQLRSCLLKFKARIEKTLLQLISIFSKNHYAESRKNRINFGDIIDLIFCKSNI